MNSQAGITVTYHFNYNTYTVIQIQYKTHPSKIYPSELSATITP